MCVSPFVGTWISFVSLTCGPGCRRYSLIFLGEALDFVASVPSSSISFWLLLGGSRRCIALLGRPIGDFCSLAFPPTLLVTQSQICRSSVSSGSLAASHHAWSTGCGGVGAAASGEQRARGRFCRRQGPGASSSTSSRKAPAAEPRQLPVSPLRGR